MKPDLLGYLRRRVYVAVDRPLGSVHPRHPDMLYSVNSGELPGTVSGDGHPVDVSLLGWDEAVGEAGGIMIAVIVRHDDDEDKLVVVRDGTRWLDQEIMNAGAFQERYFQTTLAR